jgi:phosphosulfolactate phosphohydrolase-like enzyme
MMVVIDVVRAARATAKRTTSIQNVILAVRHVAAAASKTRKVDAGTTAGEGKSAPGAGITRGASPSARSAQIRGAVSVHQDSLIH